MKPPKDYEDYVHAIVQAVSEHTGIGYHAILGMRKYREHARARAIIYRILVEHGASTVVIGHTLGCDHANVINQRKKCKDEDVEAVRAKIAHITPPPPWKPPMAKPVPFKSMKCPNCGKVGTCHKERDNPQGPRYCLNCNFTFPMKKLSSIHRIEEPASPAE